MLSTSIEDYIKVIYALEVDDSRVSTKRIAERLGVKMASVTGMVKNLAAEGYLEHFPYRGVQLTEKGRTVALNLLRRHRVIELFLCNTLGFSWDEVDADAEVLEHAVSDRLIERIYEFLGRPDFDPHGAPIPAADGSVLTHRGQPLHKLEIGQEGRVVEVSDREPELLRYLAELGLSIGSEIQVCERAPFNGPITLKIASGTIAIGQEACSRVLVRVEGDDQSSGEAR